MKIGYLGGSFDPIHKGHVRLAEAALTQLRLARVYFVLSPRSPFKLKQNLLPVSQRLTLLKEVLKSHPRFVVGNWELKKRGVSYTVHALRSYTKKHPRHRVFFIMGSDVFRGFSRWKNPDEIASRVTLVVGRRPGVRSLSLPKKYQNRVIVLKGRFPDFSSTAIRQRLRKREFSKLGLPTKAVRLIRQKGFYEPKKSR